jgi:hypothetical protein
VYIEYNIKAKFRVDLELFNYVFCLNYVDFFLQWASFGEHFLSQRSHFLRTEKSLHNFVGTVNVKGKIHNLAETSHF